MMRPIKLIFSVFLIFAISSCSNENLVTKKDLKNQNAASEAITSTLFNNDVDESATYNINGEGHVDINFDKSVPKQTYTTVVEQLRNNPLIKSVWASQGGVEVCPVP